jgi:hypothetical protein
MMRTYAWLLALLVLVISASAALAAPEIPFAPVALADLQMSTDDALQGRPFEQESPGAWFFYQGKYCPAPFGFTDATSAVEPADELMIAGTQYRFDLGRPAAERELTKIMAWWSLADSLRSGINLKFAVHDLTTGQWRDLSDYYRLDPPAAAGRYGCLTLTFPAGEVKNFDSLRMYDGRPLLQANTTRWVELDVFTSPDNR